MIGDKALADICASTYVAGAVPSFETADVHLFLHDMGDFVVGAYKGSISEKDWKDDFKAIPREGLLDHKNFGLVHPQFFANAEATLPTLLAVTKPLVLTGHSKGASEATDACAMLKVLGRSPVKLSVFAPARVGMLNGVLLMMPGASYRWQDDPVPLLPPFLEHPRPLTLLGARVLELDFWVDHPIANYQAHVPA